VRIKVEGHPSLPAPSKSLVRPRRQRSYYFMMLFWVPGRKKSVNPENPFSSKEGASCLEEKIFVVLFWKDLPKWKLISKVEGSGRKIFVRILI
jgi:hypothetical protein